MNAKETYEIGAWRRYVSPNGIGVPLDPAKTALLIVDMQRKIADRNSPRGLARQFFKRDAVKAESYFSNLERRVVPNIVRLLSFSRSRNIPVIHIVMGGASPTGKDKPFSLWAPHERTHGASEVGLILSSDPEFAIIDELRPQKDEFVVHKFNQNAFIGTAIQLILRNLGREEVLLVGGATNGCVEGTGRGAADCGFKVAVVEDAVTLVGMFDGKSGDFPHPVLHDAAMINFCSFIGRVTTTDEILGEWAKSAAAGASTSR